MSFQIRSQVMRHTSLLILLVFLIGGCGGGGGVNGAASGLTWNPPSTYANSNNTPLYPTNLKGYTVYYRTATGYYSIYNSYFVPSPSTSVSMQSLHLPPGKYYFVVTAVDMNDVESDFSNEVSKQI